MKATLMVTVGMLAMGITPAMGEDGHVPQLTLSALSLGGMQVVSDADGMQVRGMSGRKNGHGFVSGRSVVVVQIVDPKSDKAVIATSTNGYFSTAKPGGGGQASFAFAYLRTGKPGQPHFSGFGFGVAGGGGGIH